MFYHVYRIDDGGPVDDFELAVEADSYEEAFEKGAQEYDRLFEDDSPRRYIGRLPMFRTKPEDFFPHLISLSVVEETEDHDCSLEAV